MIGEACSAWMEDNAPSMGAALAFYTIFSFAPVLIIATSVAGLAFGQGAAEREILLQLQSVIGAAGVRAVQPLVQGVAGDPLGVFASTISILILFFGASGAFVELHDALNKIWKVKRGSEGVLLAAIRQRFFSLGLVVGAGLLLTVSLVATTSLHATENLIGRSMPGPAILAHAVNRLLSFVVNALVLGMIYKFMPDTKVAWRDVWFGAAIASFLFNAAKALIEIYLVRSTVASSYGAAGSLVILLVWIYFTAQFLLLGAEVAHVSAVRRDPRPSLHGDGHGIGGDPTDAEN
jgi:membrane protein